jgi:hypothetical protein
MGVAELSSGKFSVAGRVRAAEVLDAIREGLL